MAKLSPETEAILRRAKHYHKKLGSAGDDLDAVNANIRDSSEALFGALEAVINELAEVRTLLEKRSQG